MGHAEEKAHRKDQSDTLRIHEAPEDEGVPGVQSGVDEGGRREHQRELGVRLDLSPGLGKCSDEEEHRDTNEDPSAERVGTRSRMLDDLGHRRVLVVPRGNTD